MSSVFCRFKVVDSQVLGSVGEGVLLGFQCLGPSLGWGGGNVSGCLSCDVMCAARKVFCPVFPSGFGQCV